MLELTLLIGEERKIVPLEDGAWMIGRGNSCKICLPFPDVSERHALLSVVGDVAVIKDLNSSNGTFVNGVAIDDEVALDGSMVIQIGECFL